MKSLTCSSSTSPFPTKNSNFHFTSSFHLNHLVSFPLTKLPSLHFVSLQSTNHLLPLHSSSETELELEIAEAVSIENIIAGESKTVHVRFQLKKECSFGEEFAMVGDDPILGLWDPDSAIPLNWSDDHLWNLELDLPIGKLICYKFILKGITGNIVWQPGPDRILETWDTKNTIVVFEDWEDEKLQNFLEEEEEELVSSQNGDPKVTPETKLVADNFIDQSTSNANEEDLTVEVESKSKIKEIALNESLGASNEDPVTFEEILQSNAKTSEVENSENSDIEEDLMIEEGDPILVLGLPPEPENLNGTEIGNKSDNEVEIRDLPELEEKHESEIIEGLSGVEQQVENELANEANKVIENDIQWGRRTIERLLTNFGLL